MATAGLLRRGGDMQHCPKTGRPRAQTDGVRAPGSTPAPEPKAGMAPGSGGGHVSQQRKLSVGGKQRPPRIKTLARTVRPLSRPEIEEPDNPRDLG